MNSVRDRLEHAVISIYPDVEERVRSSTIEREERILWKEFSSCILSSQVPYPLSVAAAEAIDREGLLHLGMLDALEDKIAMILKAPVMMNGTSRRYRFPVSRARQLASAKAAITEHSGTLEDFLRGECDPDELRAWLVANAPGMGPKQASMFLRNSGISYDLAILDRHVLDFMTEMGLQSSCVNSISRSSDYQKHERTLRSYAKSVGAAVGLIDWAIWIVMRMFRKSEAGRFVA
ncbi:8-oxoguanine DNA glycosylase [Rhizobium brockwellii]|uniref:8-oxoguanine DNA glycosylase n=1 Tax=Rhizobium TaxID=379 RepID=UPI003F99CE44